MWISVYSFTWELAATLAPFQDQINNLHKHIASKEIESVTKSFPTNKNPGPDSFSTEFYWNFKEDIMPILLKIFHIIEIEWTFPLFTLQLP